MANSIKSDLKQLIFKYNSSINKFIAANIAVFLLLNLIRLLSFLFQYHPEFEPNILNWLSVPASPDRLLYKPWTVFTYMFVHEEFLHILFNMLWLYWIGQIFEEYLGFRKFSFLYILGGLAGSALFIVLFNLVPAFRSSLPSAILYGASASVMTIIVATATLLPNYTLPLLFFGPVKLVWFAIVMIISDFIFIPAGNAGGHISHLGGALIGFLYIRQLQKGRDWATLFNIQRKPKIKTNLKVSYRAAAAPVLKDKSNEQIIDDILDKISKNGYDSLSEREKQQLFKASQDID